MILRAVFGVDAGPRLDELKRRVRAMIDPTARRIGLIALALSGKAFGSGAGQRFEERRRALDELIYEEIERRRDAADLTEREDVFSMLLLARDEDGERMTAGELPGRALTLLVAGHETTATGLAWALELCLRRRPSSSGCGPLPRRGTARILDAVVKESLRLKPVIAGVGRVVREQPFELGGYRIPVGIEINPSIAAIHRRHDRYPAPREFRRSASSATTRPTPTAGCPSAAARGVASARALPASRWAW